MRSSYGPWDDLVRRGIRDGINAALGALREDKDRVVGACRANSQLMDYLETIATTTIQRVPPIYPNLVTPLAPMGTQVS